MGRLLDKFEASEYLGAYTPAALEKMAQRGQIPHVKIGKRLLFDKARLERWIQAHSIDERHQ